MKNNVQKQIAKKGRTRQPQLLLQWRQQNKQLEIR